MLEKAIKRYQNKSIETAQVIEELKESVQAKLRVMVKRILKKYGYPPDKQKKATETVLEQAKLICKDLAEV